MEKPLDLMIRGTRAIGISRAGKPDALEPRGGKESPYKGPVERAAE